MLTSCSAVPREIWFLLCLRIASTAICVPRQLTGLCVVLAPRHLKIDGHRAITASTWVPRERLLEQVRASIEQPRVCNVAYAFHRDLAELLAALKAQGRECEDRRLDHTSRASAFAALHCSIERRSGCVLGAWFRSPRSPRLAESWMLPCDLFVRFLAPAYWDGGLL